MTIHSLMLDEEFKTQFQDLQRDVGEIKSALIGDKFGNSGLVDRVEQVEERTEFMHNKIIYWSGAVAIVALFGSFVLSYLFKV